MRLKTLCRVASLADKLCNLKVIDAALGVSVGLLTYPFFVGLNALGNNEGLYKSLSSDYSVVPPLAISAALLLDSLSNRKF